MMPASAPGAAPGQVSGSMNPAQAAAMRHMQQIQAMAAKGGYAAYPFPGMPYMPGMPMMDQQPSVFPGANPYAMGGGMDMSGGAGKGKDKGGKGKKGGGKGRGKGKLKGSGKGKGKDGEERKDGEEGEPLGDGDAEVREGKPVPPVVQAQRAARARFEQGILDRIQGRWTDASDAETSYVVKDNYVSVHAGEGKRVFHNRLGVSGQDMWWDARRFWHSLNLKDLHAAPDPVEQVEWVPGKDCQGSCEKIVWLKAPDLPEDKEEAGASEGEGKTSEKEDTKE